MDIRNLVFMTTTLFLAACGTVEVTPPTPSETPTPPAAAAPTPASAPEAARAAAPAPAAPAVGTLTASAITRPFAEIERDDVTRALEAGGWHVGSATATQSSMYAVSVTADKEGTTARISYYRPGGAFWRRLLERDHAAIHAEGENMLGVVVEGNEPGAQSLLRSLVPAAAQAQ